MKLLFCGAPGVGKGTFARRIAPTFSLIHLSAGELLRNHVRRGTDLGIFAAPHLKLGQLVPGSGVVRMMSDLITGFRAVMPCFKGYLLDGFPRTLSEAHEWSKSAEGLPDLIVNITLDRQVLETKLSSRRVCSSCGENYNLADIRFGHFNMPPLLPKKKGECDKCCGALGQREDDKLEIIKNRLDFHETQESELLDFFKEKTHVHEFAVFRGVKQTDELSDVIRKFLERKQSNRKELLLNGDI